MVIQQYQDPSINRMLKFGFWYQAHKALLYKILIISLISFNAVFWIWTFYGVSKIIVSSKDDQSLYSELVAQRSSVAEIQKARAPDQLAVYNVLAVPSATDTSQSSSKANFADFIADVENTNTDWTMLVAYSFFWANGQSAQAQAHVLPKTRTYIAVLGEAVNGIPNDASITTEIDWERVKDSSKISRAKEAFNSFIASDFEISPYSRGTDISINISNQGTFTIIAPEFLIALQGSNGNIAGVWKHKESIVLVGEAYSSEKRFLHSLPSSVDIKIYPQMDFFDNLSYRLPSGSTIQF